MVSDFGKNTRDPNASSSGIRKSGCCCIVCGWAAKSSKTGKLLVEGAHVRPFEAGAEFDRFDNIIALCPNHHTEYDNFNFYIDPDSFCRWFREKSSPYEGLCVKDKVKHINRTHLAYGKYLYDKVSK